MNNISASEGATKISMTSMLMGAIINIILEPIFIYTLGWGIKGSAIATVVAQGVTTLLYVWYTLSGKSNLHFSIKHFTMSRTIYAQIFKVGIPTLLFQLLSSASMGLINTAASRYGDSAVAAMGVVTRVLALGSYVIFGFQYIYTTLFLALGKATKGTILSIARQGIFFIPIILVLPRVFSLNGIIFTQPLADVLTTVLAGLLAAQLQKQFVLLPAKPKASHHPKFST